MLLDAGASGGAFHAGAWNERWQAMSRGGSCRRESVGTFFDAPASREARLQLPGKRGRCCLTRERRGEHSTRERGTSSGGQCREMARAYAPASARFLTLPRRERCVFNCRASGGDVARRWSVGGSIPRGSVERDAVGNAERWLVPTLQRRHVF